jgi:hypothetical protein
VTSGWDGVVGAAGVFLLLTTIITVAIWQYAATVRARVSGKSEYRALAETSVAAQAATERQLSEIRMSIADMRARIEAMEHVLKDVE